LEGALAIAHKWLWVAREVAEKQGAQGFADDIYELSHEVTRIADDALRQDRRRRAHTMTEQRRRRSSDVVRIRDL